MLNLLAHVSILAFLLVFGRLLDLLLLFFIVHWLNIFFSRLLRIFLLLVLILFTLYGLLDRRVRIVRWLLSLSNRPLISASKSHR